MSQTKTAMQLVREQIDAYNRHDVEAYIAFFASDAPVINLITNEVLWQGHAQMRALYRRFFADAPEVHIEMVSTMVQGSNIVAELHFTGFPDGAEAYAVAIFRVERSQIVKLWLIPEEPYTP